MVVKKNPGCCGEVADRAVSGVSTVLANEMSYKSIKRQMEAEFNSFYHHI